MQEKTKQAILGCVVQRGKFKGTFRRTKPKRMSLEHAAWVGVMVVFNPYKVSMMDYMLMNEEEREVCKEAEAWADANKHLRYADRDRGTLEELGVW